jgi:monofunctional biosynthetic peptidoglycan transglycosylase
MPRAPHESSRTWRLFRLLLVLLVGLLLLPYVLTPLYAVVRPVSTLMLARWASGGRVERQWVPLEAITPALPRAAIAAEDARYCRHWGIDLHEIKEAIADADDITEARGGSTIAQQTAKNLFLWPGRSFVRKALEAPLAIWLDRVLGKRRLMEIYLNVVEWGPNGIFGAEAGARRAFGKSARDLTGHEAALMAAMLPDPVRRNARSPGPGLRRLAGIYERRLATVPGLAGCIRSP